MFLFESPELRLMDDVFYGLIQEVFARVGSLHKTGFGGIFGFSFNDRRAVEIHVPLSDGNLAAQPVLHEQRDLYARVDVRR